MYVRDLIILTEAKLQLGKRFSSQNVAARHERRGFFGGLVPEVTLEQLGDVVRDVFDDDDLEITEETTARDVEGWDSLNHIRFMVTVEQQFNIRFTSREVEGLQNVGDLLRAINSKS